MSGNRGVKGLGAQTVHCGDLSPSSAESSVSGRGRAVLDEGVGDRGRIINKGSRWQGPVPRCRTCTTEPGRAENQRNVRTQATSAGTWGGEAMCGETRKASPS